MPSRERLRKPESAEDYLDALWAPARKLELLKEAVPAEDCTREYRRKGRAQFHDYLAKFADHEEELAPPAPGQSALWCDLLTYGRQQLALKPRERKSVAESVDEANDLFEKLLENIEPKSVSAVFQRLVKELGFGVGHFLAKYSHDYISHHRHARKLDAKWKTVLKVQEQLQRQASPTADDIVTAVECIARLERYSRKYDALVEEAEADALFDELWKALRLFKWLESVIGEDEVLSPRSLSQAHAIVAEMNDEFGSPLSPPKVRALARQQAKGEVAPGFEDPQKKFTAAFDDLVQAVDPREAPKICRELSQKLAEDVDKFLDALKKDVFVDRKELRDAEKVFHKFVIDHADAVDAAVDGVNFRQLGEVTIQLSALKRTFKNLAIEKKKASPQASASRAALEDKLAKMLANARLDKSSSLEHSTVCGAMSDRTARRYRLRAVV